MLPARFGYLQQRGAQPAGPPFARYHAFEESETDLENGIPLAAPVAGEGWIADGTLPGGRAATTWHIGPYDKLGESYARLKSGWERMPTRRTAAPGRSKGDFVKCKIESQNPFTNK